jgi:hypothetical protein
MAQETRQQSHWRTQLAQIVRLQSLLLVHAAVSCHCGELLLLLLMLQSSACTLVCGWASAGAGRRQSSTCAQAEQQHRR